MSPTNNHRRWALIGPGVHLMRRLRMRTKLGLLAVMLSLPLLGLSALAYQAQANDLRVVRHKLAGAHLVSGLIDAAVALQRDQEHPHAPATPRASAVNMAQAEPTDSPMTMQAALARIDQASQTPMPFALPAEWRVLANELKLLAQAPTSRPQPHDPAAQLARQVQDLQQIVVLVAERSGLLLDPEGNSYFLMSVAVEQMLPLTENLSRLRDQGGRLLALGAAGTSERAAMLTQADAAHQRLQAISQRLDALARTGHPRLATWLPTRQATEGLVALTQQAFSAETLVSPAEHYRGAANEALRQVKAMKRQVVDELLQVLALREQQAQTAMGLQMGLALSSLALVGYFGLSFYISFGSALRALGRGVDAVAQGDLTHKIEIKGRDELADIGRMVEAMNMRMSAMVAEIRSSAVRVGMSGQQVASGSQALAQRTEAQAANLGQTVASVAQLTAAVSANAAAACELDQLTSGLRQEAEIGGTAMRDALDSMTSLEDCSRRVTEIVGVIDGIAFQTNILALNAAVEAARAGEAGRGFAVVAAEVRQLAQRSAAAAGEVGRLIKRAGEQVQNSVKQTHRVSGSLTSMVTGVRQVSDALRAIADASGRQSIDLAEVSRTVDSLDLITRNNANMVDESALASNDLVERAQALSNAVASIRLRQGSADEAHALVDQAMALITSIGYAAAATRLHSRDEGFVDRDLYVFVIDRGGHYRVHGAKPAMEGKRVHEVLGIGGDQFVRDAWAAAPTGGWIEYDIVNPETGNVQPKASYVKALDARLLVGCGVYRQTRATAMA